MLNCGKAVNDCEVNMYRKNKGVQQRRIWISEMLHISLQENDLNDKCIMTQMLQINHIFRSLKNAHDFLKFSRSLSSHLSSMCDIFFHSSLLYSFILSMCLLQSFTAVLTTIRGSIAHYASKASTPSAKLFRQIVIKIFFNNFSFYNN